MNELPTPGHVPHYQINICTSDDVARLIKITGKAARSSPEGAAKTINEGIKLALQHVGMAQGSNPSDHAKWTAKLAGALQNALALLDPNATENAPPRNLADNFSRIFGGIGRAEVPEEIEAALRQKGLQSEAKTIDAVRATDAALFGVWLAYALAVRADVGWRRQFRGRKERNLPDPFLLAWTESMARAYGRIVDAKFPRQPTAESPFVRFCGGVRELVLKHMAPDDDEVKRALLATIRGAEGKKLADFICRNSSAFTIIED
jgi:hypothetical protein